MLDFLLIVLLLLVIITVIYFIVVYLVFKIQIKEFFTKYKIYIIGTVFEVKLNLLKLWDDKFNG